jgi:hypothetical protein
VEFTSEESVKSYMHQQVTRMLAARSGEFKAHPRIQWGYRDVPTAQNEAWQLEWKIYKASDHAPDPFAYWSLSITSDYRLFIITHDNSSVGPWHPGKLLTTAELLEARDVAEDGDCSLAALLENVVTTSEPNRYNLT